MRERRVYKKVGKIILFISLNLFFTAGVMWIAYQNRTKIKRFLDHENTFSAEDKVILYDIFSSPLIANTGDLVLRPVKNSDDLVQLINKSTLPDSLDLFRIYDSCRVIQASNFRNGIIRITYQLFKDTLQGYVYVNKILAGTHKPPRVVLYIPGSGDNRVGKVANRLLKIEDPIQQASQIGADIYFPVYPTDDILAIHDGVRMLDTKKITNYLVGNNRNLSLRYLSDIFALKKYLQAEYNIIHMWGHSRGGFTATIASSVSPPDTLIVNSGYSSNNQKYFRLGPDQLWWSKSYQFVNGDSIKARLRNSKAKVFFLFGNKESEDIYGLEGKYRYTENFFKDCPNIQVKYVDDKHVWFGEEVSKILERK